MVATPQPSTTTVWCNHPGLPPDWQDLQQARQIPGGQHTMCRLHNVHNRCTNAHSEEHCCSTLAEPAPGSSLVPASPAPLRPLTPQLLLLLLQEGLATPRIPAARLATEQSTSNLGAAIAAGRSRSRHMPTCHSARARVLAHLAWPAWQPSSDGMIT